MKRNINVSFKKEKVQMKKFRINGYGIIFRLLAHFRDTRHFLV